MSRNNLKTLASLLGVEFSPVSHAERLISALGGLLGMLGVLWISHHFVGAHAAALIVASMGASAVLLFAMPHGPLSQPWPLVGGNVISAAIGVACARLVPDEMLAGALAVALAIGAMHYLRCLHPPGGATALTAVLGGPAVHELGYHYVLTPVLLNVSIILLVAVGVNALFTWRRYPAALAKSRSKPANAPLWQGEPEARFSHGDLAYALRELDSFIDISEDDLARIYQLAARHAQQADSLDPELIRLGGFYSNGRYGESWAVRQVIDVNGTPDAPQGAIVYRVVAGKGAGRAAACSREEFARWAKYEVANQEGSWQRLAG
ncbi:MAG: HPP family protein [Pseudomonadota bacterium]